MIHAGTLRLLFHELCETGYSWQPQTPDRLLAFRRAADGFRPLVQLFGLGSPVCTADLLADGLTAAVIELLSDASFLKESRDRGNATQKGWVRSSMAIAGEHGHFVIHDFWPPSSETASAQRDYVHLGQESMWLAKQLKDDLEGFIGKRVLDLGCSSGVLGLEIGRVADEVLGLDVSQRAIEWGRLLAAAHGLQRILFECVAIGSPEADHVVTRDSAPPWDVAVMNPPMVVSQPGSEPTPYRDGGTLGIEIPLAFCDFAHRHLRTGGELIGLATNPIPNGGGKGLFWDALEKDAWEVREQRCIHAHFNQAMARRLGYEEKGIDRVELWWMALRKR